VMYTLYPISICTERNASTYPEMYEALYTQSVL
jgi:hypothetical protein